MAFFFMSPDSLFSLLFTLSADFFVASVFLAAVLGPCLDNIKNRDRDKARETKACGGGKHGRARQYRTLEHYNNNVVWGYELIDLLGLDSALDMCWHVPNVL